MSNKMERGRGREGAKWTAEDPTGERRVMLSRRNEGKQGKGAWFGRVVYQRYASACFILLTVIMNSCSKPQAERDCSPIGSQS
jgi:hypothetical protein